jgi:hypothetical protein
MGVLICTYHNQPQCGTNNLQIIKLFSNYLYQKQKNSNKSPSFLRKFFCYKMCSVVRIAFTLIEENNIFDKLQKKKFLGLVVQHG